MIIADVLSRLANPEKNAEIPLDVTVDDIMLDVDDENACSIELINVSTNERIQPREMSTADHTLCSLQRVVYSGRPDTIKDLPKYIRIYWAYRYEIGISDGVIFKGKQVIIPDAMRSDILHQLHAAHLGIEKTRLIMRESVYWPNIYKDVDTMGKCCAVCLESQTEHRQQPLLAQIKGDKYLLVTDCHSKFYLVEKMHSTTSIAIANTSAQWFSMFRPPRTIATDNGPQYVVQPYEYMCSKWNIKHTTTSPRYPQSNGLIERQVRTVKGFIQKCAKTGNDMLMALQQHRCTPLDSNLSSPSEILFNRPIRTMLPSHHPTLMHQNQQQTNEQLQQHIDRMIGDHDQRAGPELPAWHAGQRVWILNKETHHWSPGEIVDKCTAPRSYIVQTPNDTRLRRTRSHLREL